MSADLTRRTFLARTGTLAAAALAVSLPAVAAVAVHDGQMNADLPDAGPITWANLTDEERRFLTIFRRMDARQQKMTLDLLDTLTRGQGNG